jgi:predicted CopG family antitoxin
MASKTISLDQTAYERLSAVKRPGESFSQVVRRLTRKRQPNLLDLVGTLSPEAGNDLKRILQEHRDEQEKIGEERQRRLWKGD